MELLILLSTMLGFAVGLENLCGEKCKNSFPLHTYPKRDPYYACLRGCRLERIDQVSNNWKESKNGAERTCEKDCSAAYPSNVHSNNACKIGCRSAQPGLPTQAAMLKEERKKAGFDSAHRLGVHPFLVVRRYCSGLYSVAVSFIGADTAVMVSDGRRIKMAIEMKGGPQYLQIESVSSQSDVRVVKKDPYMKLEEEKSSWLDCVAHKAGIPKWLLASALFVSVTAIVYLCCCTCWDATLSEDKHYKFDDVFTIDADNMCKVPLYEGDQANLLPPKYSEKGGIL